MTPFFASWMEVLEAYVTFGILAAFCVVVYSTWSVSEKIAASALWPLTIVAVIAVGVRDLWRRFLNA